mgnify:CR=1 FL=1
MDVIKEVNSEDAEYQKDDQMYLNFFYINFTDICIYFLNVLCAVLILIRFRQKNFGYKEQLRLFGYILIWSLYPFTLANKFQNLHTFARKYFSKDEI